MFKNFKAELKEFIKLMEKFLELRTRVINFEPAKAARTKTQRRPKRLIKVVRNKTQHHRWDSEELAALRLALRRPGGMNTFLQDKKVSVSALVQTMYSRRALLGLPMVVDQPTRYSSRENEICGNIRKGTVSIIEAAKVMGRSPAALVRRVYS